MSGAEVQQPGLTLEVPEPSLDAQEIPLQSPRDRKDWASQVMAVRVCGCGGWGKGENDRSDVLEIANAGVNVKGAGEMARGGKGRCKSIVSQGVNS